MAPTAKLNAKLKKLLSIINKTAALLDIKAIYKNTIFKRVL